MTDPVEPPMLPPDPEGMNDDRAARAELAVAVFQQAGRLIDGSAL